MELLNQNFILENLEIKIVNVLGEEVFKSALGPSTGSGTGAKKQILDISEINNGIYFLQLLRNGELLVTKKIVKQ